MRLLFITWLSEKNIFYQDYHIMLYANQCLQLIVKIVLFHYDITQYMSYESCIVWMFKSLVLT